MDCGIFFCYMGMDINVFISGCLIYNLISEWNDLVYKGCWKEVLECLMKMNNFLEFIGWVCFVLCEGFCMFVILDLVVLIKNIECVIIDKGFENGWIILCILEKRIGKKIVVIGSGLVGLVSVD